MRPYPSPPSASSRPSVLLALFLMLALASAYALLELNMLRGVAIAFFVITLGVGVLWPEAGLYILAFSMLLSPEITAGAIGGSPATLGRPLTFRLEDFLLMAIGLGWIARRAPVKAAGLFRKTPLNAPIAAYIVVSAIATLWGAVNGYVKGASGFFFVLKYFEYVLIYFMVVNYMNTPEQANRLLTCLFLTTFIVALYGLSQIPGGQRISAPFEGEGGEPNTYGGYLILMGAMAAALLEQVKIYRVRLGLSILLVLIFINLAYTESRSSYLAVLPTFLVLLYFSKWRLYMACGLVIVLVLSPVILPDIAKRRIDYTFNQPQAPDQIRVGVVRIDTSTSSRIRSWNAGIKDWWAQSFLGYGVTGHRFIDAQFPRLLAETGLFGMLAFLWLIATMLRFGLSVGRTHPDALTRAYAAGFTAGLVGLLVHSIGSNTFIIVRIMEPFWALAGILFVLSEARSEQRTDEFPSPGIRAAHKPLFWAPSPAVPPKRFPSGG